MRLLRAMLACAAALLVWQLAAASLGDRILPTPWATAEDLALRLRQPVFYRHLWTSGWRAGVGTLLGLALAAPLGLIMGAVKKFDDLAAPLLFLTYPAPKVLLLPVLLVLLGLGEAPKILLVGLTVGYQVLVVVRDSVLSLDRRLLEAFEGMWPRGRRRLAKAWALSLHVLVPAAAPAAATALRLASGTAVSVLFMAESFATDWGLGHWIMDAWGGLDLPKMFSGIAAMSFLGLFFYGLANAAEKLLCPWLKR
ncbi:MAG: ABC transporter permease subunit [Deltaproteobacteria bacterium]|jgi:NitT/TauT family transport system permease protein|nr:ABC transporter permease subunit [Deltaproteobacteria bacterium]